LSARSAQSTPTPANLEPHANILYQRAAPIIDRAA
jgi:hypothetical protein